MRILIAEDDDVLRCLLDDFLSGLSHEVESFSNGVQLISSALQKKPDLIITDLHMPEIPGDSMIAMLDMHPDLSGIPVLVVSGAAKAGVADMGISRDITVISKPFDLARIKGETDRLGKRITFGI
ncbi:MAG: response regulator [Elusimicrobiales bacterium]|nr:response regulator [Elusimicrobiales bacterium]